MTNVIYYVFSMIYLTFGDSDDFGDSWKQQHFSDSESFGLL